LKFVIHFIGDLHQPLHDENDGDKRGNDRHVIWDAHLDYLHWVWDSGLVEQIDRNPQALAAELERRITNQDRATWVKGSVEDWVMEGHSLAWRVGYRKLGDRESGPNNLVTRNRQTLLFETQLEEAGVKLAYVLNSALR
jgi:hypothetical protein